jgi:hypothetical protein
MKNYKFVFIAVAMMFGCTNEGAYEMLHPTSVKQLDNAVSCNRLIEAVLGFCYEETAVICEDTSKLFK